MKIAKMATIGDRMKNYEMSTDQSLHPGYPVIIRVDGHSFSKFTAGFDKPFDAQLHEVMRRTSEDLLKHYNDATTAYTQSDEITLIFPKGTLAFNGRVQKLTSLTAGYVSTRFNHHLVEIFGEKLMPHKRGVAHFDARIFCLPTAEEVFNNLLWRCRYDCQRNSKSAFARSFMSSKQAHKKHTDEQLSIVLEKHGSDYYKVVPLWAQYGTLIKREMFEHIGKNPRTGRNEMTLRTRPMTRDIPIDKFSQENVELMMSKYWPVIKRISSDNIFELDIENEENK